MGRGRGVFSINLMLLNYCIIIHVVFRWKYIELGTSLDFKNINWEYYIPCSYLFFLSAPIFHLASIFYLRRFVKKKKSGYIFYCIIVFYCSIRKKLKHAFSNKERRTIIVGEPFRYNLYAPIYMIKMKMSLFIKKS